MISMMQNGFKYLTLLCIITRVLTKNIDYYKLSFIFGVILLYSANVHTTVLNHYDSPYSRKLLNLSKDPLNLNGGFEINTFRFIRRYNAIILCHSFIF